MALHSRQPPHTCAANLASKALAQCARDNHAQWFARVSFNLTPYDSEDEDFEERMVGHADTALSLAARVPPGKQYQRLELITRSCRTSQAAALAIARTIPFSQLVIHLEQRGEHALVRGVAGLSGVSSLKYLCASYDFPLVDTLPPVNDLTALGTTLTARLPSTLKSWSLRGCRVPPSFITSLPGSLESLDLRDLHILDPGESVDISNTFASLPHLRGLELGEVQMLSMCR